MGDKYDSIFFNDYDDALTNLIQKGYVEISGVNDKGELLYQISDKGRKMFEEKEDE
jgi:DNA-binding PadR family transcriptional regulator